MSRDFWPLPDDICCPECGEDEFLSGEIVVTELRDGGREEVLKAKLRCGGYQDVRKGCAHTWTWTKEGEDENAGD